VTFAQSLEWLYGTQQFGIKLGLENIHRLLDVLGNPQKKLRIYHVAGTNGKGSVCAMLDAILRADGRKTGLYTSPHLIDFRERIRVNGAMIPEAAVAQGLTRIRSAAQGWDHSPTFFEISTALALEYFAAASCEAVVLETGLGGRLDATNAVTPCVSVITPIALDHTQWLGNTLAEIATEKAGIIKADVPVVSALQEPAASEVLAKAAVDIGTTLTFVESPFSGAVDLRGTHQRWNAALAKTALNRVETIPLETIAKGLRDVRWPGRFQIIDNGIVLDGSHNPHATAHLVQTWRKEFPDEQALVIFGALNDKDYPAMIEALTPIAEEIFFVPVTSLRGVAPENLAVVTAIPHRVFDSIGTALETAKNSTLKTLITGSLFLIGDAMTALGIEP